MDRGTWQATVHGVAESDTTEQLTHTHTHPCEKGAGILFTFLGEG